MNRYVLSAVDETTSTSNLLLKVVTDLSLATLLLFYLRKVVLIFPSLAALLIPNFRPYTTIDIGLWMIMAVVFLWGIPKLESKVELLFKRINMFHTPEKKL